MSWRVVLDAIRTSASNTANTVVVPAACLLVVWSKRSNSASASPKLASFFSNATGVSVLGELSTWINSRMASTIEFSMP